MRNTSELAIKWRDLAVEDQKMADLGASHGHYLQALFHTQQCIEKTLKGMIVLVLKMDPPYSHDLVRLARELKEDSNFNDALEKDLTELNPYYITARYPSYKEDLSKGLTLTKVSKYLNLSKEILSWLDQKLKS